MELNCASDLTSRRNMNFAKLQHGFVKIDIWISFGFYMDLPMLLHGFVNVATWIS